jgi:hypothetical protein
MLTLVQIRRSPESSGQVAFLVADYLAFDRRLRARRQYVKAFGGMALLVLLGAMFRRVPIGEAWLVASLLSLVPLTLLTSETVQRRRLAARLNTMRLAARMIRKS